MTIQKKVEHTVIAITQGTIKGEIVWHAEKNSDPRRSLPLGDFYVASVNNCLMGAWWEKGEGGVALLDGDSILWQFPKTPLDDVLVTQASFCGRDVNKMLDGVLQALEQG